MSLESRTNRVKLLGIEGSDSVVCYQGSIGNWCRLGETCIFKQLLIRKLASKMLFITFSEHDLIMGMSKAKQIFDQKVLLRKATRKQVPILLSLYHYSIFFVRVTYSKLSSSPTKHGELMSMWIPIVGNVGFGNTDSIVK